MTVFGFTYVITVSLFTYLHVDSFHTEWFSFFDPLPSSSFPRIFWTTPSGGFLSKIPIFEENKMKKNEQPWQIMTKGDWDWLCALTGCRKEDWNFRKILGCTLGPRIIRFLVLRKKNRIILIFQICIKAEIAQVSTFFREQISLPEK